MEIDLNDTSHSTGTPSAELTIDTVLVRRLLSEQHPDLQDLPINFFDAGWDNTIFRLGKELCVRLPRRKAAAKLIENEQTWLPMLAKQLNIPVPAPVRIGKPTTYYPWGWSILPWFTGVAADLKEPEIDQAKHFGSFLRSLHKPAPANAPFNPVRGVPLIQRSTFVTTTMYHLEQKNNLIDPPIKRIWYRALETSIDVEARWLHGDLHPHNILVDRGRISAIIDWGDITSGDIATDLASIWMLFSQQNVRQRVIKEYGDISEATLRRTKGWAVFFAVVLIDTGLVNAPRQVKMGKKILNNLTEDF